MKRLIIYVLGPKRKEDDYNNNRQMTVESGGWLKIGLARTEDDSIDKWDIAKQRCDGTAKTGLCETCKLFDVFEYPDIPGNQDDVVRKILSDEIYELNTSRKNNEFVDDSQYEIKAGREFVYGASRKHIISAIAKFERDLMLDYFEKSEDSQKIRELVKMVRGNINGITDEIDEDSPVSSIKERTKKIDAFFEKVIEKLPSPIKENCTHSPGRTYMHVKSKAKHQLYGASYSAQRGITRVTIEIFDGENGRNKIEQFIEDNNVRDKVPSLSMSQQGSKNKDKYFWMVQGVYAGTDETVIQWFVDNIKAMYVAFEAPIEQSEV